MGIINLEIGALVIKSLLHRKIRTFLTTLGIVIGVALVFSLISLNAGMKESLVEQINMIGADMITITTKLVPGMGFAGGKFTSDDLEAVERVSVVDSVIGMYYTGAEIKVRDETIFKSVIGIESGKISQLMEMYSGYGVKEGRFINDNERGKAVIGPLFAEDHNIGVGNRIIIDGRTFRVVGITKPVGNGDDDRNIMMSAEDLWELTGTEDEFTMILGKVHELRIDPIERALKKQRGSEDFEIMTSENMMDTMNNVLSVVNAVFLAVASISILVGSIGVANTMYVSVLERVREIGVLKSIGATKLQILLMFVFEAGLVGMAGGVVGVVLGYLIAFGFTYAATASGFIGIHPVITPSLFLISAGISFAVGIVAGFLPARWAANLEPVEALRYE